MDSQNKGRQVPDSDFRGYGDEELKKDQNGFMGYENVELQPKKSNNGTQDVGQTAEDTEAFLGYAADTSKNNSPHKDQNRQNMEEDKFPEDSLANLDKLHNDMETPDKPFFAPVSKSELPSTVKVDSILSQELKNVTLDENHFILPAPDASDPNGIKVKVYLFGTKEWVPIHISSKNKVVDVIRHLITVTKNEQKDPQAYELRLIDDDEDYYVPFYEISALEPNDSVGEFNALALCQNKSYQPPKPATAADIAALGKGGDSNSNIFTIFIKLPFLETKVDIKASSKTSTLSDLLKQINKQFGVDLKENTHWFKIHELGDSEITGANIDKLVYNQSHLDFKLMLKNLSSKELELTTKLFGDSVIGGADYSHEEKMSCSMKITGFANFENIEHRGTLVPQMIKQLSVSSGESPLKQRSETTKISDKARDVKDFLYNDLTAKQLEQFLVVKINSKGKRQVRIFGIDGFNVYNDKDPNRQK